MEPFHEGQSPQVDRFNLEKFSLDLRGVRSQIAELGLKGPRKIIFELTDDDYLKLFSEWRYRKSDVRDTTSFLLETLATKSLNPPERHTPAENKFKDIFFVLGQYQFQSKLWGGADYNSYPDDLVVKQTGGNIEIQKVIEVKLSKQLIRANKQRERVLRGLVPLINSLNGDLNAIKTEEGKRIIEGAREELRQAGIRHVNLQPEYKYVFAVPADQEYFPQAPGVECFLIPVTSETVVAVGKTVYEHFKSHYSV